MAKKPEKNISLDELEIKLEQLEENSKEIILEDWEKSLNPDSIKKMLAQPRIYPQLKPRAEASYHCMILTVPKIIQTEEFGESIVMDIMDTKDDQRYSLFVGESIKIALATERRRAGLTTKQMIGRTFILRKTTAINKQGKTINVFLVTFDLK